MKFLNLFFQGYEYALIAMEFCIISYIIIKINKMDNNRKQLLLLQIIFLILTAFAICYDNTKLNNFIITIVLAFFVPLNLEIYSEYLEHHNS